VRLPSLLEDIAYFEEREWRALSKWWAVKEYETAQALNSQRDR